MKILLDMNLSPRLCDILQQEGHVCVHWADVGDPRADDQSIMKWASDNGYAVITHDLDMGSILAATRGESPSVIQIRTQDVLSQSFQDTLLQILRQYRETIEKGALIVVDEKKMRARILPLF